MNVAVLLENICLAETGSSTRHILLFEVEGEVVTALDEDIVSIADVNYFCLWLLGKQVVRVYCDGLCREEKEFLERIGIAVYTLDTITDHPILHALLLKEPPESHENT